VKSQTSSVHFEAITRYSLPAPTRDPNAIMAARDGSVWFGEQGLPGIGHLFQNGTLLEYPWPTQYTPESTQGYSCSHKTRIGGLALWENKIWASDSVSNAIVSLDPSALIVQVIKLPHSDSYPYALTVGPEGSLWFTELRAFTIARIDRNGTIHEYKLPRYVVPTEIAFVNSTLGYFTDPGISGFGSLYSFNPSNFSFQRVGGGVVLYGPDSLAATAKGIWVAAHGGSNLGFYDTRKAAWTFYPTSRSQISDLTLPTYVRINGTKVWFNEEFGDRMGVIDTTSNLMTEYSFSSPPPSNFTGIGDVQTMALSDDYVWFTESARNYVGYLDATYQPGFSIVASNSTISLRTGTRTNITLSILGRSSSPISLRFSDTETRTGLNENITLAASPSVVFPLDGSQQINLSIVVMGRPPPGNYMVAATITDGTTYRSTFIAVNILLQEGVPLSQTPASSEPARNLVRDDSPSG